MKRSECKCGTLARLAGNPKNSVEFDPRLNEYHIKHTDGSGYSLIYFCPFCGGSAPKSQRGNLFHKLIGAEQQRLAELTKGLRTVQDVIAAFGEPDIGQPVGIIIGTREKEGVPETAQAYPVMIYTRLSEVADVHVTVYPADKVGISFQGKPKLEVIAPK